MSQKQEKTKKGTFTLAQITAIMPNVKFQWPVRDKTVQRYELLFTLSLSSALAARLAFA